jgi:hypothetical protein
MRTFVRRVAPLFVYAAPFALAALASGCSQTDEAYKAVPAFSGRRASLPAVPTLPTKAIKVGDGYTVYGAMHHLRSRVHNPDVAGKDITITGYIVKTNLPEAPACTVHKTGKGDKEDCKAPVPAFWIADDKGDDKNAIKVMGWASNRPDLRRGSEVPGPQGGEGESNRSRTSSGPSIFQTLFPNVGAKVTVNGNFGVSFTKATSSVERPSHGILTYAKLTYVEPPAEPGTLPGMPGGPAVKAEKADKK